MTKSELADLLGKLSFYATEYANFLAERDRMKDADRVYDYGQQAFNEAERLREEDEE